MPYVVGIKTNDASRSGMALSYCTSYCLSAGGYTYSRLASAIRLQRNPRLKAEFALDRSRCVRRPRWQGSGSAWIRCRSPLSTPRHFDSERANCVIQSENQQSEHIDFNITGNRLICHHIYAAVQYTTGQIGGGIQGILAVLS